MMIIIKFLLYFMVFLYGACFASFIAAFAYRYCQGLKISTGRSYCEHCKTTVKAYDLIPVFSYLALGGKCRVCKQKIPYQYFLTEILGGLICILCFFRFDFTFFAVLASAISLNLMCISLIDYKIMQIPDRCQVIFAVLALFSTYHSSIFLFERMIGFFIVSGFLLFMNYLVKECFGGGDIKLMAIAGFLFGWQGVLLAMFIALLFGGGYAIYLLLTQKAKKQSHIPFGPYLCLGIFVSMLWGPQIIGWYLGFFI